MRRLVRGIFVFAVAAMLGACTPLPYAPFASEQECIENLETSARGGWFTGEPLNGVSRSWAAPYEGGALICGYTGNDTRFIIGRENGVTIWRNSSSTGVEPLWSQYCARERICEWERPSPLAPPTTE